MFRVADCLGEIIDRYPVAPERVTTDQRLIHEDAEGKEVGAAVDIALRPSELFRRRIHGSADLRSGGRGREVGQG